MEPERPIEKLLHETARKRRTELGAPAELHPATRRLLQGEVARQFHDGRRAQPASQNLFSGWWMKLAVAACLCCVLVMVLWVVNPAPRPSSLHAISPMAKAGSVPPEASFARRYALDTSAAPALSKSTAKDKIAPTPVVAAAPFFQDREKATPAAAPPAVRALEPEIVQRAPPAINAASGSLSLAAVAPPNSPTRDLSGGVAGGNRDAFGMSATTRRASAMSPANVSVQRYSQLADSSKEVLKKKVQNPVLQSFQVEQSGEKLRIIDQDGSVYSGTFEIAGRPLQQAVGLRTEAGVSVADQAALAGRKEAAAKGVAAQPSVAFANAAVTTAAATPIASSAAAVNLNQPPALPPKAEAQVDRPKIVYHSLGKPYSFYVAGTNNSLKKRVFFSGNLFELNDVAQASGTAPGQAAAPTTNTLKADAQSISNLQLLNSRISGTAVLDGKEQVPVEAAPSNP